MFPHILTKKHTSRAPTQNAFTLIELLVVIAIISVLASILIPSITSARDKAYKATCVSNLRQISIAATAYTLDHEGDYPVAPGVNPSGISWDDQLSAYDGRQLTEAQMLAGAGVNGRWGAQEPHLPGGYNHGKLYRCPSDSRGANGTYIKKTYCPTQNFNNWTPGLGIFGFTNPPPVPRAQNIANITYASSTITYTENHLDHGTDNNHIRDRMGNTWEWAGVRSWHQEMTADPVHGGEQPYNYVMADGHVESMAIYETLLRNDGSLATSANVTDTWWDAYR